MMTFNSYKIKYQYNKALAETRTSTNKPELDKVT